MTSIKDINRYYKQTWQFLAVLTLVGLLAIQLAGVNILIPIVLSSVFHVFCTLLYGYAWKKMNAYTPSSFSKLYLAGIAFRLVLAAFVILLYCVLFRSDNEKIKLFAMVFAAYYIMMLLFDTIFFAKMNKVSSK